MGLFDASSGGGRLASSLSGELLAGALPPVDLRAVYLVRAIFETVVKKINLRRYYTFNCTIIMHIAHAFQSHRLFSICF